MLEKLESAIKKNDIKAISDILNNINDIDTFKQLYTIVKNNISTRDIHRVQRNINKEEFKCLFFNKVNDEDRKIIEKEVEDKIKSIINGDHLLEIRQIFLIKSQFEINKEILNQYGIKNFMDYFVFLYSFENELLYFSEDTYYNVIKNISDDNITMTDNINQEYIDFIKSKKDKIQINGSYFSKITIQEYEIFKDEIIKIILSGPMTINKISETILSSTQLYHILKGTSYEINDNTPKIILNDNEFMYEILKDKEKISFNILIKLDASFFDNQQYINDLNIKKITYETVDFKTFMSCIEENSKLLNFVKFDNNKISFSDGSKSKEEIIEILQKNIVNLTKSEKMDYYNSFGNELISNQNIISEFTIDGKISPEFYSYILYNSLIKNFDRNIIEKFEPKYQKYLQFNYELSDKIYFKDKYIDEQGNFTEEFIKQIIKEKLFVELVQFEPSIINNNNKLKTFLELWKTDIKILFDNNTLEMIDKYINQDGNLNENFYNVILTEPKYYSILLTNPNIINSKYYTDKEKKYLESINDLKNIIPYFSGNVRENIEKYYNDNLEFTTDFIYTLIFDGILNKLSLNEKTDKYFNNKNNMQLIMINLLSSYPSLKLFFKSQSNSKKFIESSIDRNNKFTNTFIQSIYNSEFKFILCSSEFEEYYHYLSDDQLFILKLLKKNSINDVRECSIVHKYEKYIDTKGGAKNDILMCLIRTNNIHCIDKLFSPDTLNFIENNISYENLLDILSLNKNIEDFVTVLNDENKRTILITYYNFLSFKLGQREKNSRSLLLKLSEKIVSEPNLFDRNINELTNDDVLNLLQSIFMTNDEEEKDLNTEQSELFEKNKFCLNTFGFDYLTMIHIFKYHLNEETINLIISKITTKLKILYASNAKENYDEILMLETELQKIHITSLYVLCVNNILSSELTTLPESVNNTQLKLWTVNIEETIRRIYEIDAMLTLTDLNSIKRDSNKEKIIKYIDYNGEKIEYFDFSNCEYALYAHTDRNVEALCNVDLIGNNQHLCLSPISDLGNKGYFTESDIVYGYSNIRKGTYLANNVENVGSNDMFKFSSVSSYNFLKSKNYVQQEFKSSSKKGNGHSETNLIHNGKNLPSCIIMRGEEPSPKEIAAAKKLGELLGLNSMAPLIKTQKVYTEVKEDNKIYLDNSVYNPKNINLPQLDELREEYCRTLGLTSDFQYKRFQENVEIYNNFRKSLDKRKVVYGIHERDPKEIGSTHQIHEARIDGHDVIIKSIMTRDGHSEIKKIYASLSSYRVQQLINPEGAVKVELRELDLDGTGSKVPCYLSYKVANADDFSYLDKNKAKKINNLSEGEIIGFLKELIVDHLIFSKDTKGGNFLYDKVNRNYIYGIDKDQALKSPNKDINISLESQSDGCHIYLKVFEYIKENINDNLLAVILNVYEDIINKIESLTDEEYLSLFNEYISTLENETAKNNIRECLINRKNNIRKSINNLLNEQFNISLANEMTNGNVL